MTWVILTILFGIAFWIAVATAVMGREPSPSGGTRMSDTAVFAMVGAGVVAVVWLLISGAMSIHTIGQRQVGIVYNFSGTVAGKKDPGVVPTWPWQHIKKQNVGLQREDFDLDQSNSAVSKDQQSIFARVTVNYQVQPDKAVQLFKEVGPAWKQTLLDSRVLQDFKEVTAGYTAAEITTKRPQLRQQTKDRLAAELKPYDIKVIDFFVKNIGYSAAYERAINAKNVQVQRSLQAEAKVDQARAEGEQQRVLAVKQAAANRALTASITDKLIRLRGIEKLNPNVQVIYLPSGGNFLLTPPSAAGGK